MNVKWTIAVMLMKYNVYVRCLYGEEKHYTMPDGWRGDVNPEELKRVLDQNETIPGIEDPIAVEKIRKIFDYIQTLPEDDATVDRYDTPEFPTIPTDKILQDKLNAVTDYVDTAAYETHFMVNHLIGSGCLKSRRIVEAMREVDKSEFAPMDPLKKGHYDYPIDLGYGTWMEPPYQIAGSLEYMNRLLRPGSKVLEIGSGTGYMTALLSLLGGHVTAIEHVPELAKKSKRNIMNGAPRAYFRNNFEIICMDGRNGIREKGPFDVIYISASFPDIPIHIVKDQLKPGGRMIYLHYRGGVDKHALCIYRKFANLSDEVELLHSSVYLPPLTDLKSQLDAQNPFRYNGSRRLHPEQWFTGDYEGCYFDRSHKETRIFESDYDNPTTEITAFGERSPLWWNLPEGAPIPGYHS